MTKASHETSPAANTVDSVPPPNQKEVVALLDLLQKDWYRLAYKCTTCCRVIMAIAVAFVGIMGILSWASDDKLIRLTLSKPCYDTWIWGGIEAVRPPPCQIIVRESEFRVIVPNPYQGPSVAADVSIGSIGFGASMTIGGLDTKCTNESQAIGSGQGEIVQMQDCPLADEIFLDQLIEHENGWCRDTKCLIQNGVFDTWKEDKFSEVVKRCDVQCPSDLNSYQGTVILRDASGQFLSQATEHCGSIYSIGDDNYDLAPHQAVTLDRHDWNSALSYTFIPALIIWLMLRMFIIALSWDDWVGFKCECIPALNAILHSAKYTLGGLLAKTKFIWLIAPVNALLTTLTTMRLHADCSQLVLFNIPNYDLYGLTLGMMSYWVFILPPLLLSMCCPICEFVALALFWFSMFPFLGAGCLLKYEDFSWSGFSLSFFLGINPALVFSFTWPEDLFSLSFSVIRVLLLILYVSDLLEELNGLVLRKYLESRKPQPIANQASEPQVRMAV